MICVNDELGQDIQQRFAKIELAGQFANAYFRENGVQIYLCQNRRDGCNRFHVYELAEGGTPSLWKVKSRLRF